MEKTTLLYAIQSRIISRGFFVVMWRGLYCIYNGSFGQEYCSHYGLYATNGKRFPSGLSWHWHCWEFKCYIGEHIHRDLLNITYKSSPVKLVTSTTKYLRGKPIKSFMHEAVQYWILNAVGMSQEQSEGVNLIHYLLTLRT